MPQGKKTGEKGGINMTEKEGIVRITQYKRPNGKKEHVTCRVPLETEKKAKGMGIAAELLTTGEVAIYCKYNGDPVENERLELATNGPGDKSPDKMLIKLIDRVYDERNK